MGDGTYQVRKVFDPATMSVRKEVVRTGDAPKAPKAPKAPDEKASTEGEKKSTKRRRLRRKKSES